MNETTPDPVSRLQQKRNKIREEIERNRRGDHKVPTWALALILALIIGAWLLVIFI